MIVLQMKEDEVNIHGEGRVPDWWRGGTVEKTEGETVALWTIERVAATEEGNDEAAQPRFVTASILLWFFGGITQIPCVVY